MGRRRLPMGRWLLVTLRTQKQVAVVDLKTLKVAKTIDVGDGPSEVLVSPDGKKAYVACNFSNQVAVIDLAAGRWRRRLQPGKFADGMAMAR